jgi:hypothetical protein
MVVLERLIVLAPSGPAEIDRITIARESSQGLTRW